VILALALTFDPSLSIAVDRYGCLALLLSNLPTFCGVAGCEPERFPVSAPCSVSLPSSDGATAGSVRAPAPAPGTILVIGVRAVDRAGNVSDWVGGP